MAKRLTLTENLINKIKEKCGEDVNLSSMVYYQARGISTEPISQNSLYDKGILTREALMDFVRLINEPLNTVTIQTMHDTSVLPTGKVFYAELKDEPSGHSAVYTVFGVSVQHQDIIDKVDNGIIDEVSFGFQPKQILCSECNKDFLDEDVDFFDLITGTCPECGAVMGKDGAHVIVPAIERVSELSLVTRGAAKHAKILDSIYQMAMSDENSPVITLTKKGVKDDLLKLNLCSTINKEVDMNKEDLEAALSAATTPLKEELTKMQSTLASLGEEKTALEAAKNEAEQAKAALEENVTSLSEEKTKLEADLEEAKAKAAEVRAAFDEQIQKVLVAAGLSDSIPEELEGKKELLDKAHLTLANIPVDGVARKADRIKETAEKADFSAYKVK